MQTIRRPFSLPNQTRFKKTMLTNDNEMIIKYIWPIRVLNVPNNTMSDLGVYINGF